MAKRQVLIQPKTEDHYNNIHYRVQKPLDRYSPKNSTSSSPITQHEVLDTLFMAPSTSTSSPSQQSQSPSQSQSLNDPHANLSHQPQLPKPKILKSCIRCRKHKTKCDASEKTPNPCSSCAKKGIQCKIDYVLPPQRSDNLKNLVGQVDTIKKNYSLLEDYYTKISAKLDIRIESFEEWKNKRGSSNTNVEQTDSSNVDDESSDVCKNSYNLIKLSDGSFISMNLLDDNKLIVNNKIIMIDEFQTKLNNLSTRLSYLYQTTTTSTNGSDQLTVSDDERSCSSMTDMDSTDDNSSIASPVSVAPSVSCSSSYQHGHESCQVKTPERMTSISSSVGNTAKSHDSEIKIFDLEFSFDELYKSNKFLLVLLVGFYYGSNDSINSLNYNLFLSDYLNSYYQIIENQNKASNSSTYSSFLINSIPGYHLTFHKDQLKDLIDCEIFNSETFLKKLIQVLFLNVLLYGLDEHFKILKNFIHFIEKNINSNRKKISFEKNEGLKFIDQYIKLFDSLDQDVNVQNQCKSVLGNFQNLLKLNLEFINNQNNESENHQPSSMFQSTSISTPHQSLFTNNTTHNSIQTHMNHHHNQLNNTLMMKNSFKRFITQWDSYFTQFQASSHEGLFIDDFILETFIINCLIFINEGHQEFNKALLDFLSQHTLHNTNLSDLVEYFRKPLGQEDELCNDFTFSCGQFQHISMNLILSKKEEIKEMGITEIQVILENVDWKTESTDDVLKKIGVI